jgi:peptidoglycan hydrolase-like protein with peptidoglycan-binding domain
LRGRRPKKAVLRWLGMALVVGAVLAGGYAYFLRPPPEPAPANPEAARTTTVTGKPAAGGLAGEDAASARPRTGPTAPADQNLASPSDVAAPSAPGDATGREAAGPRPTAEPAPTDQATTPIQDVAEPLLAPPSPSPAQVEAALDLKREDWRRLQDALTALGFDTSGSDGKPGANARRAVAAWQGSKRQEQTGYLSGLQPDLILTEAQPKLDAQIAEAPATTQIRQTPDPSHVDRNPSSLQRLQLNAQDKLAANEGFVSSDLRQVSFTVANASDRRITNFSVRDPSNDGITYIRVRETIPSRAA